MVKLNDGISFEKGAALLLQGMTAMVLTKMCYKVTQGDTVLIHAAAGGTGLLLVQLCKLYGATVIGTTSTTEKQRLALEAGADHVILYRDEKITDRVMEITKNQGVDAVFDGTQIIKKGVGKSTFSDSLLCLKKLGSMISFGNASGAVPHVNLFSLTKGIKLCRPLLFQIMDTKEIFDSLSNEFLGFVSKGKVNIFVSKTYPLSDSASAHSHLEAQKTVGKILLNCRQ